LLEIEPFFSNPHLFLLFPAFSGKKCCHRKWMPLLFFREHVKLNNIFIASLSNALISGGFFHDGFFN